MYICKNCGQTYSDPVNFCGKCGGDSFDSNDYMNTEYSPNVNPSPTYTYASAPAPASENKAPAIVGMSCGVSAVLLAFYMLITCADLVDGYYYSSAEAFGLFFGFSFFIVPLTIVGLIMSFKAGNALKGMSLAGKITSFVSMGILALTFLMCVGSLM